MKASTRQAAFVASVFLLGAAGLKAQSCTNATLTGTYGYLLEGNLVEEEEGEDVYAPYADSGILTADGNGNFTGTGTESFTGTIEQGTTISGTYTVNSNCTGSATLNYGSSIGTFNFSLVVLNGGEGISFVDTDSGAIVSGAARQQQTNCILESLNGLYSFTIDGSYIDSEGGLDPLTDSGILTFNGTGGLSVFDTLSEAGTVTSNRSYSGSYHTHSNCTAQATFDDPTLGTLQMNMVILADGGIRLINTGANLILSGTATPLGDVAPTGTMAQVASGGGWLTTFTLTNTGTSPANIELNFFDNNGDPLSLPLIFLDSGETTTTSTLTQTIAADATIVVATNAGSTAALATGSAQLTSSGGSAGGFAVFHFSPSAQEAVVPIQTQNAAAYVLAFDDTNGLATGLALANVSNQAVKVPMIVRDDTGAQLGTATIGLAAHGHTSFVLPTTYSFAQKTRGTVEFDTPSNGQISVLGIRGAPTGTFTTIPVLVK